MTERDATEAQHKRFKSHLGTPEILKHSDQFTSGVPDASISWKVATTWLEYKMLDHSQIVFDELREDQLMQLFRLEQQCQRSWCVAWQKGKRDKVAQTLIYRPSFLLKKHRLWKEGIAVPEIVPKEFHESMNVHCLWTEGVLRLRTFDYDAVATLIKMTH